jgi:hypothetical protein
MKHHAPEELFQKVESVAIETLRPEMSRRERLERWADVLGRHGQPLNAPSRIEYLTDEDFAAARVDRSALTVAYQDPVLRSAGLKGDRLGDAVEFFGVSRNELHDLLCDCFGGHMSLGLSVAARVRGLARRGLFVEYCRKVLARIFG